MTNSEFAKQDKTFRSACAGVYKDRLPPTAEIDDVTGALVPTVRQASSVEVKELLIKLFIGGRVDESQKYSKPR